jgi:hypothetical protein
MATGTDCSPLELEDDLEPLNRLHALLYGLWSQDSSPHRH